MRLTKYNVECGLNADDFARNRRTVHITYRIGKQRNNRRYVYTFPMDVLTDIGAKELASRIYSVFKLHINRTSR